LCAGSDSEYGREVARAGLGAAAGGGGRGEAAVRATLAASGLLKFFECPLLRAQEHLLHFLIEMWSPRQHCFLVRGERVAFTAEEDVYFLTGLPFRGTLLLAALVLLRDTDLAEVSRRFCSGRHYMTGSAVCVLTHLMFCYIVA
jgi:hypothetical protein